MAVPVASCHLIRARLDVYSVGMAVEASVLRYSDWSETCDTLHAHAQVLGKLAAALAPPEPQLQHAALRLSARGWETPALPAVDGSGAIVAVLDLQEDVARVEHSDGRRAAIALTPHRSVGEVARELLEAVRQLAGPVAINWRPQEVPWQSPLDEDRQHRTYEPEQVRAYFRSATLAALILSAFRAPYRGRSTPVNAWWGSFDLAVSLFSGRPASPPSEDFIMRNAMDSQEVAVGWWPGDERYGQAAMYAYAHPAPEGFAEARLKPLQARWESDLGEFILDWSDVLTAPDPRAFALEFLRSTFAHACSLCGWDPALAASAEGDPPPIS